MQKNENVAYRPKVERKLRDEEEVRKFYYSQIRAVLLKAIGDVTLFNIEAVNSESQRGAIRLEYRIKGGPDSAMPNQALLTVKIEVDKSSNQLLPISTYSTREIGATLTEVISSGNEAAISLRRISNYEGERMGVEHEDQRTYFGDIANSTTRERFHPLVVSRSPIPNNQPMDALASIDMMDDYYLTFGNPSVEVGAREVLRQLADRLITFVHHRKNEVGNEEMLGFLYLLMRAADISTWERILKELVLRDELLLVVNDLAVIIFNLSDLITKFPYYADKIDISSQLYQQIIKMAIHEYRQHATQEAQGSGKDWLVVNWAVDLEVRRVCPAHIYSQLPEKILDSGGSIVKQPPYEDYNPDAFVNRQLEIEEVKLLVRRLLYGERPRNRTVRVEGANGVGKTWLMRRLANEIPDLDPEHIECIQVNFGQDAQKTDIEQGVFNFFDASLPASEDDFELTNIEVLVLRFMKNLAHRWSARTVDDATPAEQSYWLTLKAQEMVGNGKVVVIMLDDASKISQELVDELENRWLKHMVRLGRVMVIESVGSKSTDWISPELREVERIDLQPFLMTSSDTELGLDHVFDLDGDKLATIYEATGGYPYHASFLAKNGIDSIDALVDLLLGLVPAPNREEVRFYLEAMLVLNSWDVNDKSKPKFREEHMRDMFIGYAVSEQDLTLKEAEKKFNMPFVRNIARQLKSLGMISWNRGTSGYQINPAIGFPLNYWMRTAKHREWVEMHQAAKAMWDDLAIRFPRHSQYYLSAVKRHEQIIGSY